MKIIKNKFFICCTFLFLGLNSYAQGCVNKCNEPVDCSSPDVYKGPPLPPCEELPINENIFILFFIALLFGIYVIYKYQQDKKTAV